MLNSMKHRGWYEFSLISYNKYELFEPLIFNISVSLVYKEKACKHANCKHLLIL